MRGQPLRLDLQHDRHAYGWGKSELEPLYTYPGGAACPLAPVASVASPAWLSPPGTGYMLIAALEGTGDIYAFPLDDWRTRPLS